MEYQLNDDVAVFTFDDGRANVFSHPQPLACTGQAIAAGAFLLLTADNRASL